MTPRGIRNRNPGNIRFVEGITSTYLGCTGSDGAFCIFDTHEHGIRALGKLLLSYQQRHGIRTIRDAINRWAPPVENDTGAYVNAVASSVGYGPDVPLDFSDPGVLRGLATAIIQHENGQQPYDDATLDAGIALALGIEPQNVRPAAQAPAGDAQPAPTPQPTPAAAETPTAPPAQPAALPKETRRMPILALLSAFGPLLGQLIPQIAKVVNPQGEVAQRNVAIAEAVINTVVQASGQPNVQAAVEAMQADPELTQRVTEAVVTSPALLQWLEVGGGIAAAHQADAAATQAEKPFWYSPVFWVSLALLPLVYIVVYRVLWADGFSDEIRTVVVTAIATGLLSSITGYYMGSAMGSQRKDDTIAKLTSGGAK